MELTRKEIVEQIESVLDTANWRYDTANKDEQQFAGQVVEVLRECLFLMDEIHDELECQIQHTIDEASSYEFAIDDLKSLLSDITKIASKGYNYE